MEHYYQNIHGWFDYEKLFQTAIQNCPENGKIVELGCWKGKSSSYLIVEAYNSTKNVELNFVDTWAGSPEHLDPSLGTYEEGLATDPDFVYKVFLNNINKTSYPKKIHRMHTFQASKMFEDNSIDFLYIDTAHEFKHVEKEISLWYPKVKCGGNIAGHDIFYPGVMRAVKDFSRKYDIEIKKINSSWIGEKI